MLLQVPTSDLAVDEEGSGSWEPMPDVPYDERLIDGQTWGLQIHTVLIAIRAIAKRRGLDPWNA